MRKYDAAQQKGVTTSKNPTLSPITISSYPCLSKWARLYKQPLIHLVFGYFIPDMTYTAFYFIKKRVLLYKMSSTRVLLVVSAILLVACTASNVMDYLYMVDALDNADTVCFDKTITLQDIAAMIDIRLEEGKNKQNLESACDIYCTNLY
eukprot:sb/3473531/